MSEALRCPRCGRSGCTSEIDCLACLNSPPPPDTATTKAPGKARPARLAALQSPLRTGMAFRGFEIGEMVGEGGMAVVYKARQTTLDRPAAIKVLAPEYLSSPRFVQRFEREAKVLASLNHPNLVHVYEFGRQDDLLFLAMEYVEGSTLQEWFEIHPQPSLTEVLPLVGAACQGLDRIHRAGLIHRDLKPSNILIPHDGAPKISDFGLAIEADDSMNLTLTGSVVGTPQYMSPEQVLGRPIDHRSDLYSLGVILFQAIAGRLPFEGVSTAVLVKHAQEAPPSLRDLVPGIPESLDRLVRSLLAKNPADRPDSALKVKEQLDRAIAELKPLEAAGPIARTSRSPEAGSNPSRVPAGRFPVWQKYLLGLILVLLVLAMALTAVIAYLITSGNWGPRAVSGAPIPKEAPRPELKVAPVAIAADPVGSTVPALRDPVTVSAVQPGLVVDLYKGYWSRLPRVDLLKPSRIWFVEKFGILPESGKEGYALRFTGLIQVPRDGEYTFTTASSDGSRLLIGGVEVVSNDGRNSIVEKSGRIGLKVGRHPITVEFFQHSGQNALAVSWEGPGLAKNEIPAAVLSRVESESPAGPAPDIGKPAPAFPAAGDWPQWRGPNRDNISTETGLLTEWPDGGPPLLWKATGLGLAQCTVSVAGGRVYSLGDLGGSTHLFSLDAATGREVWQSTVGPPGNDAGYPGPRSTPATDGTVVLGMSAAGDLICCAVSTGQVLWKRGMKDFGGPGGGWGFCDSPLIDGKLVLCAPGGSRGSVVALYKSTGQVVWQSSELKSATPYSSLVAADIGGVRQYILLAMDCLAGVEARTGRLLWRIDRQGRTAVAPTPIVRGNLVFAISYYGDGCNCYRIEVQGGKFTATELYANRKVQNHHGGVVQVNGYVYGLDGQGLSCLDLQSGEVLWTNRSVGKGSITYADGHLICRTEAPKPPLVALVEASPEGYREKGRFLQPEPSGKTLFEQPVIAGGRLYLRDQDTLLCYDLKDHSPPGKRASGVPADTWPSFRGPGGMGKGVQVAPLKWNGSTGEGVTWKFPIPKAGSSSPVVWGKEVFVTGADAETREVYAFDSETGASLWTSSVGPKGPSALKMMEGLATALPTPVVSGSTVAALFSTGDIAAFDRVTGAKKWERNIGVPRISYGHASSLLAFREKLLVQYDGNEGGQVLGLNLSTGVTEWSLLRAVSESWSSPILANTGSKVELILNARPFVSAQDPQSGKTLWRMPCFEKGEMAPSPAYSDGIVFALCPGERLVAIQPGADPKILWEYKEDLPDISSPVVSGKHLLMASSTGVITCLEAATGKKLWSKEFEDGFHASPIVLGDRAYLVDTKGVTTVLRLADTYEELARNPLGERVVATPAFVDGRMYLRSEKSLYCIADP